MDDAAIEAAITACPLFAHMDPDRVGELRRHTVFHAAAGGTFLFRQGDPCPGIVIVLRGAVRVFKIAPSGKEHLLRMVGVGDAFAEVAVIGGFPIPACAQAVEACEYLLVAANGFNELLHRDHDFCLELLRGLSLRVHRFVDLLEDIVLRDASARLARHLADRSGGGGTVELVGSKKDLASHLNLTPETCSRVLGRLKRAGLIEEGRKSLRVVDNEGLREHADGLGPTL